eukprot:354918-Pelagomonas_calceolata.AAC.1
MVSESEFTLSIGVVLSRLALLLLRNTASMLVGRYSLSAVTSGVRVGNHSFNWCGVVSAGPAAAAQRDLNTGGLLFSAVMFSARECVAAAANAGPDAAQRDINGSGSFFGSMIFKAKECET